MSKAGFSVRTIGLEVLRNTKSSPLRSLFIAIVCLAIGATLTVFVAQDIVSIREKWAKQIFAGRFVEIIRVEDPQGLFAKDCDSLASITGVIASGGVVSASTRSPESHPFKKTDVIFATPGFLRIAWPNLTLEPQVVGVSGLDASENFGLVDGSIMRFPAQADSRAAAPPILVRITRVAQHDSRVDGLNGAIVIPIAAGDNRVKECYVEYEPSSAPLVSPVVLDWFPSEPRIVMAGLMHTSDLIDDPNRLLQNRPSGLYWTVASGVIAMVMLLSWVARRGEFSLYRFLCMSRLKLFLYLSLETLLLLILPFQAGALLGYIGVEQIVALSLPAEFRDNIRALCLLATTPLLGILFVGFLNPMNVFKDS